MLDSKDTLKQSNPQAKAFGLRLQKKRKAMGLTAEGLAKLADCSDGYIGQLEAGMLPKKMGSGAIARVKKVLKVRARGFKASKRPVQSRAHRVPSKAAPVADLALVRVMSLLLDSIRKLNRSVSKLADSDQGIKGEAPKILVSEEASQSPASPQEGT